MNSADSSTGAGPFVRVTLPSLPAGEVQIRRDNRPRPAGADNFVLHYIVDDRGHVVLQASDGPLECWTTLEPGSVALSQKANPEVDDDLLWWFRRVFVNLQLSLCLVGSMHQTVTTRTRLLAAAAGRPLPTPSESIDQNIVSVRTLCSENGVQSLWAIGDVATRTDDENATDVTLLYARPAGILPWGGFGLADSISTFVGFNVTLERLDGTSPPEGSRELLRDFPLQG